MWVDYGRKEKVEIAWRYLLPRLLEEHGISDKDLQFTDESLSFISSRYSREAGLRNFERNCAAIMRKRKFELAAWEVYEAGKPWREADGDVAEALAFRGEQFLALVLLLGPGDHAGHHPLIGFLGAVGVSFLTAV